MTRMIQITDGRYRGMSINGVFPLLREFKEKAGGEGTGLGTVQIYNTQAAAGMPTDQRVTVRREHAVEVTEGAAMVNLPAAEGAVFRPMVDPVMEFQNSETEEEAMGRIARTFEMFDRIVDATTRGVIRGLIVSGPPGIGKSFGVERQLEQANLFRKLAGQEPQYELISGGISAIGLYQKLYHNRAAEQVLVFDDCDGVLFDEESLNLLKAALNSGHRRRIAWNKQSRTLGVEDIPQSFDFEGSIIFLSNISFERAIDKGSRISEHLNAIMSRCHYLDLEISSERDKLLRIKQIIRSGMLGPYGFNPSEEASIVEFVFNNAPYLREISLRIVKKIADLVKAHPNDWYEMAETTVLKKEARYQRLIAERARAALAAEAE